MYFVTIQAAGAEPRSYMLERQAVAIETGSHHWTVAQILYAVNGFERVKVEPVSFHLDEQVTITIERPHYFDLLPYQVRRELEIQYHRAHPTGYAALLFAQRLLAARIAAEGVRDYERARTLHRLVHLADRRWNRREEKPRPSPSFRDWLAQRGVCWALDEEAL